MNFVGRGRCFRVWGWRITMIGVNGIGDGGEVGCGIKLFS